MGLQPTFKNSVREENIDISLASESVTSKIRYWRVSDEISMSNHPQIKFEQTDVKPEFKLWRNPKKTDWVVRLSSALTLCGSAVSLGMRKVMARSSGLRSSLL